MRFEKGGRSREMVSLVKHRRHWEDVIREKVSGHTTCIRSIDLIIS